MRIEPEKFVEVWQTSSTVEEVTQRLGLTNKMAVQKANYYRKRGVPLKTMYPKHKTDWEKLAELARSLAKET